jgi:hypothetical protein
MTIKNKKKKYWITHGYEGVEILVPMDDQDSYAVLDENADDVLFGESDEEIFTKPYGEIKEYGE